MIKEFIINLLFRLIDGNDTYKNIQEDKIKKWQERQYISTGFREYWRKRDLQILKQFASGIRDDDMYWVWVGRRLELLKMAQDTERAYNKMEEEKKKKLKSQKKGRK